MVISFNGLVDLVDAGVISTQDKKSINSASIDIHLGNVIMVEDQHWNTIDYRSRQPAKMTKVILEENDELILTPGMFILAQSRELFFLPRDISAEYKLKSSMARIGLEHLNAGWCDAGWNGSVLTLELKNMTQRQNIILRPGDAIGQMIFYKHEEVPEDRSYAARGRYNNDKEVKGIKE